MEENHLKEGIVPADSCDDQSCDWKKQEMISAFTLLSEKQKWIMLTSTGIGYEGKSGLLKGVWFTASGSGDLCLVNGSAPLVLVHSPFV